MNTTKRGGLGCGGLLLIIIIIAGIVATSHQSPSNGTNISLPNSSSSSNTGNSGTGGGASAPEPGPFNGQSSENLGTITVPSNTILHWSCPSCGGANGTNFIIGNSPNDASQIYVNALDQASGRTVVDGGVYHDVQVEGGQSWTVTFSHQ